MDKVLRNWRAVRIGGTRSASLARQILLLIALAVLVAAPSASRAQACKTSGQGRCQQQGAVCSPVDIGSGATGKCQTRGTGSEAECDCVGAPSPAYTLAATQPTVLAKVSTCLAISQPQGCVIPGDFVTSTITLTAGTGYSGTVTLSCIISGGGAPAPTCSQALLSVPGGPTSTTIIVQTLNSTPDGTYSIAVTGTDGNGQGPGNGPQNVTLIVKRPGGVGNFCPFGTCDIPTPVYLNVFWDTSPQQWDNDIAGMPTLSRANIDAFTAAVVHSQYLSFGSLLQYNVTQSGVLPGITVGNCGPVPADIDQAHSQLGVFASCVMSNLPFPSTVFSINFGILNVFLPPRVGPSSTTADFCSMDAGEHDKYSSPVEVTFIPTNSQCTGITPATPSTARLFKTLTHEMIEAATDPIPNSLTGWKQPFWAANFMLGPEIGDICDDRLPATPFLSPDIGAVAQFWSNSDNSCSFGVSRVTPAVTAQRVCGVGKNMLFLAIGNFDAAPWDLTGNVFGGQTLYLQATISGQNQWTAGSNLVGISPDAAGLGPIQWTGQPPQASQVQIQGFDKNYGTALPNGGTAVVSPGDTVALRVTSAVTGQSATVNFTAPFPSTTVSRLAVQSPDPTSLLFVGQTAQVSGIVADASGCAEQIPLTLAASAGNVSPNPINTDETGAFSAAYIAPAIAGPQSVQITSPFQLSTSVNVLPVMSSLQPVIGTVAGGQPVILQGSGFAPGATSVSFNTSATTRPAQNVQVSGPSQVNFVTPPSPLPGDGTGTALVTTSVNGVKSLALEYLYVVPDKPVLDYDPPHLNPFTFQCSSPAVTINVYTPDGQPRQVAVNLSAPYQAFFNGTGTTSTLTVTSGQTISMAGTGPITATNAQSPSLSLTEQFPYILLPPPRCSQRTFPVASKIMASAMPFVPHAIPACTACADDLKQNTTIWTATENISDAGTYVGIVAEGTEDLTSKFDVVAIPVNQVITNGKTAVNVTLLEGKPARAILAGPVIRVGFKNHSPTQSEKLTQICSISMELPNGAPESGVFHIVHMTEHGGKRKWTEDSLTQVARGRAAVAHVGQTGIYALVYVLSSGK